jgi:putative Mg2+ transporter-C (MgtC) family protein
VAALEWYEIAGRLLLATLLGGALGLEREFDGHDAGLRTHLLVTVGAALFAVMSVAGFDAVVGDPSRTNVTIDVTRIVSYIAPGVGFIGGGAILKSGGKVTGITTAASLWVAAAVGAASGIGFWVGAVTATVIALFALEVLQPLSRWAADVGRRRGRLPN